MAGLREALETAFDTDTGTATEPDVTPSVTPTEPDVTPSTTVTEPVTTPTVTDDRARDGLGRFTKTEQADGKGQVPPKVETPPVAPVDKPQGPRLRLATPVEPGTGRPPAPKAWPVTAREHWNGTPDPVRQQIIARETEFEALRQTSEAAMGIATQFQRTVQPFMAAIQAETGGDPFRAVQGLMDVATRLRFGTPAEKAQKVAQIISAYGVDIATLDSTLAGLAPTQPQGFEPGAIDRAVEQRLAPLLQQVEQRRQQSEQQVAQESRSEIEAFASDPKNEFFEDVRYMMADAMEIAERNKHPISLADAYDRACQLHPEVRGVMLARQQGQTAQNLTQAAARAKQASVSVKGAAPVGNPSPTAPSSTRDAIEAAIEAHSRV